MDAPGSKVGNSAPPFVRMPEYEQHWIAWNVNVNYHIFSFSPYSTYTDILLGIERNDSLRFEISGMNMFLPMILFLCIHRTAPSTHCSNGDELHNAFNIQS